MWRRITDAGVRRIFGDGFEADLAHRGVDRLNTELRQSFRRAPEQLTGIRLHPGESYTVVARPAPTRQERRVAKVERAAFQRHRAASRPTARQLSVAHKLERAQRRLATAKVGSRRHRRAVATEAQLGAIFDRRMKPSARQERAASDYEAAATELTSLRSASYERARTRRRRGSGPRVRVFD